MIKLYDLLTQIDFLGLDIDGLLVRSKESIDKTVKASILEYTGREATDEEVKAVDKGGSLETYFKRIEEMYNVQIPNLQEAIEFYYTSILANQKYNETFDGAKELIRKTKEAGVPMGLITNAGYKEAKANIKLLEDMAGEKFYETVFCAKKGISKPGTGPMRIIQANLANKGHTIEQWAYAGDNQGDMEFVKNCNEEGIFGQGIPIFVEQTRDFSELDLRIQKFVGDRHYKNLQEFIK